MTVVSFDRYREKFIFECKGHTGFGEAGSDILCSAVSVLCYTLLNYLEGAECEGIIYSLRSDFRDGEVYIEFEAEDDAPMSSVNAILGGFTLLSENFPDYIDAAV